MIMSSASSKMRNRSKSKVHAGWWDLMVFVLFYRFPYSNKWEAESCYCFCECKHKYFHRDWPAANYLLQEVLTSRNFTCTQRRQMSRNCVRVPAHLPQKPPKKARSRYPLPIQGAAEQQVREKSPRDWINSNGTTVGLLISRKLRNTCLVNKRGANFCKANFV